jgi:hypothetical protein
MKGKRGLAETNILSKETTIEENKDISQYQENSLKRNNHINKKTDIVDKNHLKELLKMDRKKFILNN